MRIAIVADIHGNLTALEAVVSDLQIMAPDMVLHGGDLADAGSSPAEVIDRVRELEWPGVLGNTDEMLIWPDKLVGSGPLFDKIREMAEFTRARLGAERLQWLRGLPLVTRRESVALVHASPASAWKGCSADASEAEMEAVYGGLNAPTVVYGHLHVPFVRELPGFLIANAGSAGLPYDGDTRASYLLLDGDTVTVRRVAYSVASEQRRLASSAMPHAAWVAQMLGSARFMMP